MARIEISGVEGLEEAFKQLREEIASNESEGWLSGAKAIGEYLGVPAETVHNWRQQGRLDGVVGQDNPPHGKLVAEKSDLGPLAPAADRLVAGQRRPTVKRPKVERLRRDLRNLKVGLGIGNQNSARLRERRTEIVNAATMSVPELERAMQAIFDSKTTDSTRRSHANCRA